MAGKKKPDAKKQSPKKSAKVAKDEATVKTEEPAKNPEKSVDEVKASTPPV